MYSSTPVHHVTLNQRLHMHRRAICSCFRPHDFVEGLPTFALSGAVDKKNRCKRYSPTVLLNSDCQQRLTMIQQIASTLCHEVDCDWCTLGLVQNYLNTKTCVMFTFLYYNSLLRYLYFHFGLLFCSYNRLMDSPFLFIASILFLGYPLNYCSKYI